MKKYLKKTRMEIKGVVFGLVLLSIQLLAQPIDSTATVDKKKLRAVVLISGVGYSASLLALSELWYKDSGKQSFAFFNDNAEWKQVDKLGHFYAAFYLSYGASKSLLWCGLGKNKSDNWGTALGFLILLPIEIFDGFSESYGASTGDLLANAAGATFYYSQSKLWNEVRIRPKFSFQRTEYPSLREDRILGNGFMSELIKDYNGQTYWLSVDMDKFIRFPKWLNIVAGYGAEGMVFAQDRQNATAGHTTHRQYYLGIDFDLSHIHSKSRVLNTLLFFVNMIKLPAPALEMSTKGVTFRAFQF